MEFLPQAVRAEHRGGFKVHLVFNDGTEGTADFEGWLEGPVFEPIRDVDYFRCFFIEAGTIVWPNGAGIAPDTLYKEAKSNEAA